MKTHTPLPADLFSQFAPLVAGPALSTVLTAWFNRQRQRARLCGLDDRMLNDIGVERSEAVREARRWT